MKMRVMARLDKVTRKPKIMAFKDSKQSARERDLLSFIKPHQPPELWTGPLKLCVSMVFGFPDNWPRWKVERIERNTHSQRQIWPTRKPDMDNMIEMIQQVMIGVIYRDDAQICIYETSKMFDYQEHAGWYVKIEKLFGWRHEH
jgi:Holliday junction resolvase RusA-like endonuclease